MTARGYHAPHCRGIAGMTPAPNLAPVPISRSTHLSRETGGGTQHPRQVPARVGARDPASQRAVRHVTHVDGSPDLNRQNAKTPEEREPVGLGFAMTERGTHCD